MIHSGELRRDLCRRLNIIRLERPPLRERKGDIPLLCQHFAETLGAQHGRHGFEVSSAAIQALLSYDCPGNVRKLGNFMSRAIILCRDGVITPEHLPSDVTEDQSIDTSQGELVERFSRIDGAIPLMMFEGSAN